MESREARVGTRVRLLDGARRGARGRVGTIERTYGHPDHLAADVRFEDRSAELCWHHELAKAGRRARTLPRSASDNGAARADAMGSERPRVQQRAGGTRWLRTSCGYQE
jgi:hypothetical protein